MMQRIIALSSLLGMAALLAMAAARTSAQEAPQVSDAVTLQTVPDIEQEPDKYKICGIRVLFRDAQSAKDPDIYDLTVAMILEGHKDPVTVVRATVERGDMLRDQKLLTKARQAPATVAFDIAPVRYRIGVRGRHVKDDTLLASVDESMAGKAGAYGLPLMSQLMVGEPVIVYWSASPDELRALKVRTRPTREGFDALQSCMSDVIAPAK